LKSGRIERTPGDWGTKERPSGDKTPPRTRQIGEIGRDIKKAQDVQLKEEVS